MTMQLSDDMRERERDMRDNKHFTEASIKEKVCSNLTLNKKLANVKAVKYT